MHDRLASVLLPEFKDKGYTIPSGDVYIWYRHVADFIKACKNKSIAIIGYDGFYISDNQITPDSSMIVDLSSILSEFDTWQEVVDDSCYWSQKLFDKMKSGENIALNFVLETEDDWLEFRRKIQKPI